MSTTYARRNYARSTAPRGPIMIKNPAADASEAQMRFVRSLVTEELLASLDASAVSADTFAALAAHVQGQPLTMGQASAIIEGVKGLAAAHQEAKVATATPGLAELSPRKIIPNRFAKGCEFCPASVPAEAGWAVLVREGWFTVCASCAAQTAADRRKASVAAQQAAEVAAAAKRAVRADIEALATDLARRIDANVVLRLGVALPNEAGTNDLMFVAIDRGTDGRTSVTHLVGGDREFRLNASWAIHQLERLACLSTAELHDAMALFGAEFGRCGRCGRSLTDEESRARGLGPDCAERF